MRMERAMDFSVGGPQAPPLVGEHQLALMLLAFVLACLSAYNALRAAERVTERRRRERWLWRGIGALSLGGGIWAMHFIGLLAYRLPVAIGFAPVPILLSLLVALLAGLLAMLRVGDPRWDWRSQLLAAVWIALGLMAMQALGLVSMQTSAHASVQVELWVLSALIALATAYLALRMMRYLQRHRDGVGPEPILLTALAIGTGAIAMHLTGLEAVRVSLPAGLAGGTSQVHEKTALAIQVGLIVGILAGLILLGTYVGRRADRRLRTITEQLGRSDGFDAVTGLPLETLAREQMNLLSLRITRPAMIALFVIDCDRAQRAALLLGESGRDAALRVLAQRLGSMNGSERDILAVLDANRFVVIAPVPTPAHAGLRAGFIADLCMAPLELQGRTMRLPVRIGYGLWPQDGGDYASLLESAELALRNAQESNTEASQYTPELRALSERRLEIEQALAAALDEEALELAYQPIVRVRDRSLAGIEALVRWRHPTLGPVPPDEFIAVAEGMGLAADIDRWVLRRALADFATLPPQVRRPLRLAVNCAAPTLARPQLQAEIEALLGATGISPRRLTLEITEVAWAKGSDEILSRLEQLCAAGIALAIDDFGTGHSSLARLRRIPANTLKIDREFVASLGAPRGDELVRSIIELGRRLDITVVAEGVETEPQERFLATAGCDLLQGYRYGRPVPWEQLALVAARRKTSNNDEVG